MCALFLRREGGARRFPWRGGPNSIITANEDEHPEVGRFPQATFPARTQGPTGKGTSAAEGGGGEVLEDTGPLRHMSADVETDDHDEFVVNSTTGCWENRCIRRAWTASVPGLMQEISS